MKNDKRKTRTSAESSRQVVKSRERPNAYWPDLVTDDYQKVIHDLRVHQAELAAQNEELRQMQHMLEASHARYMDLYDHAPVGYFTLDRKGRILSVNRVGSKQLGLEPDALLKRPIPSFMSQDDSDLFHLHLRKIFAAQCKQTCSLTLLQENGIPFYAR